MEQTLIITDNRTGKQYSLPIEQGAIRAMDLRQIKVADDDFGLMSYDPALTNTASCRSKITFIDGDKGILRYRGYPIEQLAEKSSYLEVAFLILSGELPTKDQLQEWSWHITHHTFIHENIKKFMDGFHHDAHPMGMLVGTIGLSRLSIPMPRISSMPSRDENRSTGSSARSQLLPLSLTVTVWGCPMPTPTTTSVIPETF
jgi:citrate synthase